MGNAMAINKLINQLIMTPILPLPLVSSSHQDPVPQREAFSVLVSRCSRKALLSPCPS